MARKESDIRKDQEILKTLSVGAKVFYISKDGSKKEGVISKITEYDKKRYVNYSSVTVVMDNGRHINVSPRNLTRRECISLKALYECGHENLKYGGRIEHQKDGEDDYYDLLFESGIYALCDGETVEVVQSTPEFVRFRCSEGYEIIFSTEELEIAVFG